MSLPPKRPVTPRARAWGQNPGAPKTLYLPDAGMDAEELANILAAADWASHQPITIIPLNTTRERRIDAGALLTAMAYGMAIGAVATWAIGKLWA